jgi:ABC-2 type transport system permease protein
LAAIVRKELADHFSGWRFIILGLLMAVAGISAVYVAAETIRGNVSQGSSSFVFLQLFTTSSGSLPPFTSFVAFLGPLLGLALGFDAINGERTRGTLSRLLAQPIHRDDVINGKFVAGLATIGTLLVALVLFVCGLGLHLIGVPPQPAELARLALWVAVSIVYVAFWLSLAVLFSLLFRQVATAALAGIAAWLFFTIFVGLLAGLVASGLAPATSSSSVAAQLHHIVLQQNLNRLSPEELYAEATATLLTPGLRTLGPLLITQAIGMVAAPLSLGQSLLLVWPEVVGLVAATAICFAISYILFLRQEIRAL